MSNFIIKQSDLNFGDVLLYSGNSFLDKSIKQFDGSPYSHTAIYFDRYVLESDEHGVNKNLLQTSILNQDFIDVFRFNSDNQQTLGTEEFPIEPIKTIIEYYQAKGDRYEYESILLLAILTTTRRIKIPIISWVIRNILEHALQVINVIKDLGKEPMICSELVYRCFNEAVPQCKYKLKIPGTDDPLKFIAPNSILSDDFKDSITDIDLLGIDNLKTEFLVNYNKLKRLPLNSSYILNRVEEYSSNELFELATNYPCGLAVASYVTPHDLISSPNLIKVGRLNLNG